MSFSSILYNILPTLAPPSTVNFNNPCLENGREENIIKEDENNSFVIATLCLFHGNHPRPPHTHTLPTPLIFLLLGPSEFPVRIEGSWLTRQLRARVPDLCPSSVCQLAHILAYRFTYELQESWKILPRQWQRLLSLTGCTCYMGKCSL